jgi:hypothetical protein
MSGGGGGPIIRGHSKTVLTDPTVHGQLSSEQCALIDPILAKEESTWDVADRALVGSVYLWALIHLN